MGLAKIKNNCNFVNLKKIFSKPLYQKNMKKIALFTLSVVFVGSLLTSCRSHERCAAYGKINKIDTGKSFTDKTEKAI